jgi:hypothetical protein
MANYLKMKQRQQVLALLELGWTYRRIEAETGVRRETVSRYDRARRANAAKVFLGSEGAVVPSEGLSACSEDSKPAKVTAGSGSNAAKVFPGVYSEPIRPLIPSDSSHPFRGKPAIPMGRGRKGGDAGRPGG